MQSTTILAGIAGLVMGLGLALAVTIALNMIEDAAHLNRRLRKR